MMICKMYRLAILFPLLAVGSEAYRLMKTCPRYVTNSVDSMYLQVFGDWCYFFDVFERRTHTNARYRCQSLGGSLAMPKTASINDFLTNELFYTYGNLEPTWIGLHDTNVEGLFYWDDGTPLGWSNFEITHGTWFPFLKNCIALLPWWARGKWEDFHCSVDILFVPAKKPFVCQFSAVTQADPSNPFLNGIFKDHYPKMDTDTSIIEDDNGMTILYDNPSAIDDDKYPYSDDNKTKLTDEDDMTTPNDDPPNLNKDSPKPDDQDSTKDDDQDSNKNKGQDTTTKQGQDTAKDAYQDATKGGDRDKSKNDDQDQAKDNYQDTIKGGEDQHKTKLKDKDNAKDNDQGPTKNGDQDPAKDVNQHRAKDGEQDPTEDVNQHRAKDGEQDPTEDGDKHPAKNGDQDPAKNGNQSAIKDVDQDTTKDKNQDIIKDDDQVKDKIKDADNGKNEGDNFVIAVDISCPKFNCPDLDCGMSGFKMSENACQLCECNF